MNLEQPKLTYQSPIPQGLRFILLAFLIILPIVTYVAAQYVPFLTVLGAFLLLAVGLVALISFDWGLYIFSLYVVLEPLLLKFIPTEWIVFARLIPETIIAAMLLVGFARWYQRNIKNNGTYKFRITDPVAAPLFLFLGICLISILINHVSLVDAAVGLRQLLRFLLLYEAVVLYAPSREQIKKILILVAGIAVFESALGLLQAWLGPVADNFLSTGRNFFVGKFQVAQNVFQIRSAGTKIFATMGRYDQLGTFLALVMSLAVGFAYELKGKVQKYIWLVILISLPALFLTYSRASLYGFLFGLLVVAVFIKKDKKILASFLVLLTFTIGYVAIQEVQIRRLIDTPQTSPVQHFLEAFSARRLRSEYTGKGRLFFLIEAPKALVPSYAVLGVGPGQFGGGAVVLTHNTTAYDELDLPYGIYGTSGQIDNNWLSIFGETGFLGLVAYLAMFIAIIRFCAKALKNKLSSPLTRSLALGLIGATLGFIIQGALGNYFEVRTLAPFYWLAAAFLILYIGYDRQAQEKGEVL